MSGVLPVELLEPLRSKVTWRLAVWQTVIDPLAVHPGPLTTTVGPVPPPLDGPTGTVKFLATWPPVLLMATQTYVLVVVGFTVRLPLEFTLPIPDITTRAAPVARQVSTTALPGTVLIAGFAVNDVITGRAGGVGDVATFTVTLADTEPKLFVAVSV